MTFVSTEESLHALDDIVRVVERFEKLPILVQLALVRLARTVADSSPRETDEADVFFTVLLAREGSPLWESPKRHLEALQQVREAVAAQIIINKHMRPDTDPVTP